VDASCRNPEVCRGAARKVVGTMYERGYLLNGGPALYKEDWVAKHPFCDPCKEFHRTRGKIGREEAWVNLGYTFDVPEWEGFVG